MGAVRRLATVVIIGLMAISTAMVVYLAAEPDRRTEETDTQNVVAIERGTDLYITYCLQCHGPAGLGGAGKDGRIGAILNQGPVYGDEDQLKEALADGKINVIYQSDDPVLQEQAEDWLRFRITYGVPAEPIESGKIMPAFGTDLNVEEMNDLVYLIMHGDWDYVYNTVVQQTGAAVAEAECEENPDGEYCDNLSEAPPAYPTVPSAAPADDAENGDGEATPEADTSESDADAAGADSEGGDADATIEAEDINFSKDQLTVKPGDTIEMTNTGQLEHDFVVDELGIHEVTPGNGDTVTITIPEDAEPGDYEFYCSVPGHKEAGMVGTLTIEG